MPAGAERGGRWGRGLLLASLLVPAFLYLPFRFDPRGLASAKGLVFALLAGAALLLLLPRPGRGAFGRSALLRWGALYVLAVAAAAVFSRWPSLSAGKVVEAALLLGAAACAAVAFTEPARARAAHLWLAGAGAVLSAVFLAQLAGLDPLHLKLPTTDLPSATFANPNLLATFLAAAWPAAFLAALRPGGATPRRAAWAGVAILILAALASTRTEGALLGWLLSLLVLGAALPGKAWIRRASAIGACILAALLVLAPLLIGVAGPAAAERLPGGESTTERAALWRAAVLIWRADPVAGLGPGAFGRGVLQHRGELLDDPAYGGVSSLSAHAHNDLLETLATTGLLGAVPLILLLGAALRTGLRRARSGGEEGWAAAGLASGLAALLAHSAVHFPLQLWGTAGLAWAMAGMLAPVRADAPSDSRGRGLSPLLASLLLAAAALHGALELAGAWRIEAGHRAAARGDLPAAASSFRRAVRLRPAWIEPWSDLGVARLGMGQLEAAADAFESARALVPEDPVATANLATVRLRTGRRQEAADLYREAAGKHYPPAVLALAGIARLEGRTEEARALYERYLRLDPGNELALRRLRELKEPGPGEPEPPPAP